MRQEESNNISSKENRYRLCLNLDQSKAPETVDFFLEHIDDEFSTYELASKLVELDKMYDMPRSLFDYIVALYKIAIEDGNIFAMNDLGALYYDGRGCNQDYEKVIYYYEMAAKSGNMISIENLGYCYYYGRHVSIDYEKAFHYFALGAFRSNRQKKMK